MPGMEAGSVAWPRSFRPDDRPETTRPSDSWAFERACPGCGFVPNNLRLGFRGIIRTLDRLGIEPDVEFFEAGEFDEKLVAKWRHYLWPLDALRETGRELLKKINRSRVKLKTMPPAHAVVESYLVVKRGVVSSDHGPFTAPRNSRRLRENRSYRGDAGIRRDRPPDLDGKLRRPETRRHPVASSAGKDE